MRSFFCSLDESSWATREAFPNVPLVDPTGRQSKHRLSVKALGPAVNSAVIKEMSDIDGQKRSTIFRLSVKDTQRETCNTQYMTQNQIGKTVAHTYLKFMQNYALGLNNARQKEDTIRRHISCTQINICNKDILCSLLAVINHSKERINNSLILKTVMKRYAIMITAATIHISDSLRKLICNIVGRAPSSIASGLIATRRHHKITPGLYKRPGLCGLILLLWSHLILQYRLVGHGSACKNSCKDILCSLLAAHNHRNKHTDLSNLNTLMSQITTMINSVTMYTSYLLQKPMCSTDGMAQRCIGDGTIMKNLTVLGVVKNMVMRKQRNDSSFTASTDRLEWSVGQKTGTPFNKFITHSDTSVNMNHKYETNKVTITHEQNLSTILLVRAKINQGSNASVSPNPHPYLVAFF